MTTGASQLSRVKLQLTLFGHFPAGKVMFAIATCEVGDLYLRFNCATCTYAHYALRFRRLIALVFKGPALKASSVENLTQGAGAPPESNQMRPVS